MAKKYKSNNIPMDDFICAGNEGLVKAAEKFNPKNNNKFITYAAWWIRDAMNNLLFEQHRDFRVPKNRKSDLTNASLNTVSMDKVINGEEGSEVTIGDMIADRKNLNPEELYCKKETNMLIRKGLKMLKKVERDVLERRYGFDNRKPESLAAIGNELGYSKERIRQIEAKALCRMREILEDSIADDFSA